MKNTNDLPWEKDPTNWGKEELLDCFRLYYPGTQRQFCDDNGIRSPSYFTFYKKGYPQKTQEQDIHQALQNFVETVRAKKQEANERRESHSSNANQEDTPLIAPPTIAASASISTQTPSDANQEDTPSIAPSTITASISTQIPSDANDDNPPLRGFPDDVQKWRDKYFGNEDAFNFCNENLQQEQEKRNFSDVNARLQQAFTNLGLVPILAFSFKLIIRNSGKQWPELHIFLLIFCISGIIFAFLSFFCFQCSGLFGQRKTNSLLLKIFNELPRNCGVISSYFCMLMLFCSNALIATGMGMLEIDRIEQN